jgi:hypothetical protein
MAIAALNRKPRNMIESPVGKEHKTMCRQFYRFSALFPRGHGIGLLSCNETTDVIRVALHGTVSR